MMSSNIVEPAPPDIAINAFPGCLSGRDRDMASDRDILPTRSGGYICLIKREMMFILKHCLRVSAHTRKPSASVS